MNYNQALAALSIGVAVGIASIPAAFAGPVAFEHGPNLVSNGGFETGDFTGWIAAIGPFSGVDASAANTGTFGAFGGDIGVPGTITQNLATVAGASYNIHFWLSSDGAAPNQFFVNWNGVTVFSASDLGSFGYTEFVIDPAATSASTTLQIGFQNDFGFLQFDDVSVRQVPEPLSLALFGAGLLGLGWARRKTA